ncbi:carboxypeptidase inhibitor-like [Dermacentor variabilis]|uniref:carboxypeptidase inhibitor-like n=1 Tax=Dermacentor variabilis TaxID=34621 RepID=UPI003F5C5015
MRQRRPNNFLYRAALVASSIVSVIIAQKPSVCDEKGYGCVYHTNCPKKLYLPYAGCSGFKSCCKIAKLGQCYYKGDMQ